MFIRLAREFSALRCRSYPLTPESFLEPFNETAHRREAAALPHSGLTCPS